VTSSGLTSEPIRVVAERLTTYSGQSLMRWTSTKYGQPQSYTLAALANQLQVNVEGNRRMSHIFAVAGVSSRLFDHVVPSGPCGCKNRSVLFPNQTS